MIKKRITPLVFIRNTFSQEAPFESSALQQVVLPENKGARGNQLDIQSQIRFQIQPTFRFQPIFEWKKISAHKKEETGDATIFGLGAGITWRVGGHLQLDTSAKYLTGGMNRGQIDLSGVAFTGGIRTGVPFW